MKNATQLAEFVQENYEELTGWTKEGMDEEKPFNVNVWNLLEENGVNPIEFADAWLALRERSC